MDYIGNILPFDGDDDDDDEHNDGDDTVSY